MNLSLQFQQEVTLTDDPKFSGLYEGQQRTSKGVRVCLTVIEPGATGHRKGSIRWFDAEAIMPARSVVAGGVSVRKVKDGRK